MSKDTNRVTHLPEHGPIDENGREILLSLKNVDITCLATVMLTTSQYMAILLPGEVFQDSYRKAKVAPEVLSRTLEDGGTLFAFLVPWSAAAIYSSGVLGVSAVEYLPFAFLPLLCPQIGRAHV